MILKKFEELTISDNFMFQKVMQVADICKEFIEKLLHIEEMQTSKENQDFGKRTRYYQTSNHVKH